MPDGLRTSRFEQLRKSPVAISDPAFNQAVVRYLKLKASVMQSLDFTGIPPVRFNALARYKDMISVYKIARMPPSKMRPGISADWLRRVHDALPILQKATHVRTCHYLSDNVKQSHLQCVNVFCSATFRTIQSIDEVIRPPAETVPPEPAPAAAVPPRRVLDCARSSLRH